MKTNNTGIIRFVRKTKNYSRVVTALINIESKGSENRFCHQYK